MSENKSKKKKTLTISTSLSKKIDISSFKKDGKRSFSIEKKKPFKSQRDTSKPSHHNATNRNDNKKRDFVVTVDENTDYPQYISIQFTQIDCIELNLHHHQYEKKIGLYDKLLVLLVLMHIQRLYKM